MIEFYYLVAGIGTAALAFAIFTRVSKSRKNSGTSESDPAEGNR
jgi:hypothetical protein